MDSIQYTFKHPHSPWKTPNTENAFTYCDRSWRIMSASGRSGGKGFIDWERAKISRFFWGKQGEGENTKKILKIWGEDVWFLVVFSGCFWESVTEPVCVLGVGGRTVCVTVWTLREFIPRWAFLLNQRLVTSLRRVNNTSTHTDTPTALRTFISQTCKCVKIHTKTVFGSIHTL